MPNKPGSLRALCATLLLVAASAGAAGGDDAPAKPAQTAPLPPPKPRAPADCADAMTARVQARYDRMRDLEARFTQRTISQLSPAGDVSTGRVTLAKPGKMHWSYETPEPSLVVSDGKTLWIYDATAREAQKLAVSEQFMSGAAFQFLLGDGRIADSFAVRAADCGAARVKLTLTPKSDATYQHLELDVDAASGEAHATAVVDLFGNRTEVAFSETRYDRAPSASTFQFAPEPGVRVIELDRTAP